MPSRKRRCTEISLDPDEHLQYPSSPNALLANDPEKEQDVWEAFRDEHFEAIEQVPLTLHRQFALMNELDQQANDYTSTLLPTLLKYIKKRRDLIRTCVPSTSESDENHSTLIHEVEPKEEQPRSPKPIPVSSMLNEPTFARPQSTMPSAASQGIQDDRSAVPRLSTPLPLPRNLVKPPTTTRQMLSHIAGLAEELLRASEEKVNVAQAAYDSVDRHVRILQQAIKEQEASITLGARPGHLEPGNLSDLTVGRWMRPSRATLSPINSDDFEEDRAGDQENAGGVASPDQTGRIHVPAAREGRKGRGRPKVARPQSEDTQAQVPPLTITLPAQPGVPASSISEETYCYCQQGSFGEMIACDNKKCPREWYHVGCVGLQTTPEGLKTWYCPDCRPARRAVKRK